MNHEEGKTRFSIEIFGTTYKLVGTMNEKYIKQLSKYINDTMGSIAKSNPRLDSMKVAVLSLVHMADEHYQLRNKWETHEYERTHAKQHIEELRKAFELSEEKERNKTNEIRHLYERIDALEKENIRIAEESGLASLTWAEQLDDVERKYKTTQAEAEDTARRHETYIRELEAQLSRRETLINDLERTNEHHHKLQTQHATAVNSSQLTIWLPEDDVAVDPQLPEKYLKLKEEYAKLQNEFNEWVQLTQSEPQ
jgi:cell division protein ZapA (FtsZ GTPase activity inhibitor)